VLHARVVAIGTVGREPACELSGDKIHIPHDPYAATEQPGVLRQI
jgi:hypothetical protein